MPALSRPRIGVLVVAYNAATTLNKVLDRIPREFVPQITEVLVCDDASQDSTYLVGLGYQQLGTDLPLRLVRHPVNLGYGGNQKAGYRWAMEDDLDIVVLLHGDGQYAPEFLPQIVQPLIDGTADAVFGSRMMNKGEARAGGMPYYKYLGNRVLTQWENSMVGMELTEWHSGYRAYSVAALRDLPLERNSDGFDFDTEIIVQLHEAGKRIVELPIPTYYGDEICYVDGMKYAADVAKITGTYRLHKMGFGSGNLAFASNESYELKADASSSHGRLLAWLSGRPAGRVLDLGCSDGLLAERIGALGHEVVGVDLIKHESVDGRVSHFTEANLDDGIPAEIGGGFDVVVCADILEHVRNPGKLLRDAASRLVAGGSILASVPNFAHWYPRTRTALGLFGYDRRGILDSTHIRFFTKRSFEQLVAAEGLSIVRRDATGLPIDVADRGVEQGTVSSKLGLLRRIDRISTSVRPQLFGYQFIYELKP